MPGRRAYSQEHHAVAVDLHGVNEAQFFERMMDARAWIAWRLKRAPTEAYLAYHLSNPVVFCGAESGAIRPLSNRGGD